MGKEEILTSLAGDELFKSKFAADVKVWEDNKNLNKRQPKAESAASVSVQARQTEMIQTSEHLGNLWPRPLYKTRWQEAA